MAIGDAISKPVMAPLAGTAEWVELRWPADTRSRFLNEYLLVVYIQYVII
jgi:hypothetical protein